MLTSLAPVDHSRGTRRRIAALEILFPIPDLIGRCNAIMPPWLFAHPRYRHLPCGPAVTAAGPECHASTDGKEEIGHEAPVDRVPAGK
jgi:hypothetical protein